MGSLEQRRAKQRTLSAAKADRVHAAAKKRRWDAYAASMRDKIREENGIGIGQVLARRALISKWRRRNGCSACRPSCSIYNFSNLLEYRLQSLAPVHSCCIP